MSLLDPNLDIVITERTLYELAIKQLLKNSNIKDMPINKIYYHNRVREENRYKYIMHYNMDTGEVKFLNLCDNIRMYPWRTVLITDEKTNIDYLEIYLFTIFEQIKNYNMWNGRIIEEVGEYTNWMNELKSKHPGMVFNWIGGEKPQKFPYEVQWEIGEDSINYKIINI